jgi:hypothetical protein
MPVAHAAGFCVERISHRSLAILAISNALPGRPLPLVPAAGTWELRVAMKPLPKTSFTLLPIEERPHDGTGTGKGWSFKTLEHDAHNFPHAIEATDAQGRSATMFL